MMKRKGDPTNGVTLALVILVWLFTNIAFAYPDRVVTTLNVGDGPVRLALDGDDKYVYVTNMTANTVSRINAYTFQVESGALTVGTDPTGVVVRTDNARVYVANSLSNTISVINTTDFTVATSFATASFPQGLAMEPSGAELYVTTRNDDLLRAYNTQDNSLKASLDFGDGTDPFDVAVTPNGDQLLVISRLLSVVVVVNADDFSVDGSVGVGALPQGIAIDPGGEFAYVANSSSNSVSKIDIANLNHENSVTVGGGPFNVAVGPGNDFVYVTLASANSVGVIQVSDFSLEPSNVTVGRNPQGLALTSDGRYLLVANEGDDTVSILTDGPYVSIQSTEPSAINDSNNPTSTVTWRSDRSGAYQVEVGGNGIKGSGQIIDTGTVVANQDMQTQVTDTDLTLGDAVYFVFVYVDETDPSTTGRIATEVTLDTVPPTQPGNLRVTLGDELLRFEWNASTDSGSGIQGYRISYGTQSGQLDQTVDTGNVVSYNLTGLTNGTTYFATVSALDKATNVSDPSNEVSEEPEAILGAVPPDGGCFIETAWSPGRSLWVGVLFGLAVLFILLGLRRGKRGVGLWILLVLCSGVGHAYAEDYRNITGIMVGFKAGYFSPTEGRVEETYNNGGFAGAVTITWVNLSNFETSVGLGLKAMNAEAVTTSGRRTAQDSTLLMVPVEFTIRYRFEYVEKQLLIPYVDGGLQGVYYNEDIEDFGDENGFTAGYHGSLGVRMSLDTIAAEDAGGFYEFTGTKQAFLFMEGRYEVIDRFGQEDFNLGGWMLTMGIEFEF